MTIDRAPELAELTTGRALAEYLLETLCLLEEKHQGAKDTGDHTVLLPAGPASCCFPAVQSPHGAPEEHVRITTHLLGGRHYTRPGLSVHRSIAPQDTAEAEEAREAGPSEGGRRTKGRGWRFWAKEKPMKQRINEGTRGGVKGHHRRRVVILGALRPSQIRD